MSKKRLEEAYDFALSQYETYSELAAEAAEKVNRIARAMKEEAEEDE